MNLHIRAYRETEEAAVAALWRRVFPDAPAWNRPEDDIRRKLTVQRELFLVALMDDNLVGTAMAGFDGHRGWIYYVVVTPEQRHRGIGGRLMDAAERALAAAGCTKVNLQVRSGNDQVVAFYNRLGYGEEPRVSMGKRLDKQEEPQVILEIATLDVRPGQAAEFERAFATAQDIIASMPGYRGHELRHSMENRDRYVLLVHWERLQDHTEGFRKSQPYQKWKALLHHFYDPFPTVEHFEVVELSPGS